MRMGGDQKPGAQQDEPQNKWGDAISDERKGELRAILDAWNAPDAHHGDHKGPFDRLSLDGADVFWLANQVRVEGIYVPDLHLETLYVNTPLEAGRDIQRSTGVGRLEA